MDTFEMTIQRASEEGWPVVVEWSDSKVSLPVRSDGLFQLDLAALNSQITPRDYGTILGQALFRDDVRDAFMQALTRSEDHLSVLLFVEERDLRILRWERLCVPLDGGWDFLSLNQRTPFSLYLPSVTQRRFRVFGRRDLRALILVASPEDLERYRLTPFDVEAAVTSVRAALGAIPCDVLATVKEAVGPPTLDAICEHITTTPYTLLHLVCHGRYHAQSGETVLYLTGAHQLVEPVSATQLVERFKRVGGTRGLPHFAFLATCESASSQAEGALGGLAQRLVRELGMPAVLAMTEQVSLSTAQVLAQRFYRQLHTHGQVDLAVAEACAGLLGRADITVPVLYSRLGARPLFSDALDRELTSDDLRLGLSRLKDLFLERAPILWEPLQPPLKTVQESVGKTASLSEAGRSERKRTLEEINLQCLEALDSSFHALALGEDPPPYDSRCPFQGLAPFGPEHREFFFGREALIERLQQQLQHHPFLAVVGSSGCGKSSLVLAGVVPALQHDEPELQLVALTPGSEPLDQLQGSLAHMDASRPCVLVVDQFEELFTLCSNEQKRRAFLKALLALINQHRVVITMRTDFLAECAPYQTFKTLVQAHLELVAPMDPRELRRAMERQVAAVGLRFDADLGSRILEDVEREPAAMPLLQHALLELWKRRHGRWLRAEEYRAIGGIQQAIAKTAETIYRGLDPAEQQRVREIFVRLTKPDVDALPGEERRDTRQRVELEELVLVGSELEATKGLVKRLADARLIVTSLNGVTGHQEVEMAHEALIHHWPRLRTWLNEERDSLRLHARLREAAREWERRGKPKDQLYRGSQLKEARAWAKRTTPSRNEVAFLRASVASRVRFLVSMIAVVLMVVSSMVGASWVLTHQPPDPTLVSNLQDDGKPGSLRYAVDGAPPKSTITFSASLRGPILLSSGDLNIAKNLKIRGPGAGKLWISGGKSGHIVRVIRDFSVTISGLTFKDSSNTNNGFIVNEGTLTLSNSTVSGNTSSGGSGGIYNYFGTLTLTNSTVSGNTSTGDPLGSAAVGGGIYNHVGSTLILSNSTVSGNTVTGPNGSGGGIYNSGTLTLSNSTVSGNTVTGPNGSGGGIYYSNGTLTLSNSTVSGNTVTGPNGSGGGIYSDVGTLTLTNSTVSGNTSTGGGGIFIQSTLDAIGDVIAQADLTFSTIYGNTAHGGGDIAIEDLAMSSDGSTSKAIKQGSQVKIRNSIVAGDRAHPGPDIVGMLTSYGYNLFQDNSGATFDPATSTQYGTDKTLSVNDLTKLFADPVGLRDNGGPTKTYALFPGTSNPAIGKVPLDACHIAVPIRDFLGTPIDQYTITTDQRGMKRPDGNEQFCDIGAYEATD